MRKIILGLILIAFISLTFKGHAQNVEFKNKEEAVNFIKDVYLNNIYSTMSGTSSDGVSLSWNSDCILTIIFNTKMATGTTLYSYTYVQINFSTCTLGKLCTTEWGELNENSNEKVICSNNRGVFLKTYINVEKKPEKIRDLSDLRKEKLFFEANSFVLSAKPLYILNNETESFKKVTYQKVLNAYEYLFTTCGGKIEV